MSATVEQKNGYKIVTRRGTDQPSMYAGTSGLYKTPRSSGEENFYRPRPWITGRRDKGPVDEYEWSEILEFSQQLFAQRGNLGWAVVQKNLYAFGDAWQPTYLGKHESWGNELEAWLREVFYVNCDVRGGVFDFNTSLFLSGVAWDVDGDDLMVPAVREDGFPQLKFYTAREIGSRPKPGKDRNKIKGGEFDGAEVCNGIIVDRNKRFLGVNILGETEKEDEIIPAYHCDLEYEPQWRSELRGIPRVGKACMDWFNVEDIDKFIARGVKLDASIGLLSWNEAGEAPTAGDIIRGRGTSESDTTVEAPGVKFESVLGGEIYYMRAGRDEKMEGLKTDRPHPNAEAFIARLERRGLNAVGWFYELLDPSKLGGAPTRAIQDAARFSVRARQKTGKKRFLRAIRYAVGQGMKAGLVPKNYDGMDCAKWGCNLPPQLTVDQGYDEDADREGLKMGTRTLDGVCQKGGVWWEDNRKQRTKENTNLIECAAELVKHAQSKGQELTFREALDLMQQSTANGRPVVDNNKDAKGAEEGQE
jgi:hypothetical protein